MAEERENETKLKHKLEEALAEVLVEKRQIVMADTHPVVSLFFKQAREKLFSFSKTDAIMLYKGNKF